MEKTRGLVLTSIKYGDTSAILQVYSKDFALISIWLKGFYNKKNKKLRTIQFPFTEIEFSFSSQQKSELKIPSNLQISQSFYGMHQHPIKAIMLQFIAEVVYHCIKQDEKNVELFNYLQQEISIFNDKKDHFAEFHLILFLNLTSYFGFSPNQENYDYPYFDLIEGRFTQQNKSPFLLSESETMNWKILMQSSFSLTSKNKFNKQSRQRLTENLLDYLRIHIDGFREPKSLLILKDILKA